VDARLVVIDPLMAYLGSDTNSYRDQDVRGILAPLARLADRTSAAIVVIRHFSKGQTPNVLYRGGGSIGIIGVAPDVKLMAYKACWQASASSAGRCNSFTLAQALADALAAKPQVINLSLVGPSDPLLEALIAKAVEAGIIVVGAVSGDARLGFPAKLPGVLGVAEAESTQQPGSGYLRAPARDILTLVPNGHYDFASGSSLAAAQVSGIVALLLARNQKLGFARLRMLLEQSTEKHDTTRGPFLSVNACAALALVVSGAVCARG
jgi:subtilisin family serine protease